MTTDLMAELFEGLAAGEVTMHYQPRLDLRAGRFDAVEALIRWRHPTRGLIQPHSFLTEAEDRGRIAELTDWTLGEAVDGQRALREAGYDLPVLVNLAGSLLKDEDFVVAAIDRVLADGASLGFEISERALVEETDTTLRALETFRASGIAISVDDFGAGLTSLTALKKAAADSVKIDRGFIASIDEDVRDRLLVKSIIDLAHGLGLKAAAEGVESPAAIALLAGMGCDHAQGYAIARPMPLGDVVTFIGSEVKRVARG